MKVEFPNFFEEFIYNYYARKNSRTFKWNYLFCQLAYFITYSNIFCASVCACVRVYVCVCVCVCVCVFVHCSGVEIHSFRSHIRITSFGVEIHSQNSGIHSKVVVWITLWRVDSAILSVDFHSKMKWSLIWLLKEWISTPVHLESVWRVLVCSFNLRKIK